MLFQINEKFWSFGDEFRTSDENGKAAFLIVGEAFSWGDKLSFQSADGRELAYISQKLFSFQPRYEIYREGRLFAEVVKEFTWFNKEFTLDVPPPDQTARIHTNDPKSFP